MFQRPAATHRISYVVRKDSSNNAHLLGVNSLALDTSTLTARPQLVPPATQDSPQRPGLSDTSSVTDVGLRRKASKPRLSTVPGGILYTAGRDGMIASWDLHLEAPVVRDIPGESPDQPKGLPPSTFRQSFNHHTDWVNDIVLCHNGESLISASSDRTVKLVRPHSSTPMMAHTVGTHGDYAKTLAYASNVGWLASGGLDRTVMLWDIQEGRTLPNVKFSSIDTLQDMPSKASIYALACNPSGSVLATGSPEKIIRVWDPRSGKRITKLAGHTDNIRALLVSENGDTILSASSDTTIKLWSLTAQRCISTFTMHSDSVWSLYSDHPQLETFYGGGKDGLVTKTEVNRSFGLEDGQGNDQGQCVVICKADAGVAKLVAHDNARLWTATSSSSVYQWPDIPTRAHRSEEMSASIVPSNVLQMNLGESLFMDYGATEQQYYPTSTVYSAASLGSILMGGSNIANMSNNGSNAMLHPVNGEEQEQDDADLIEPVFTEPENVIQGEHGLIKHTMLNNRRMVVTEDKCGEIALWDIIQCTQLQTFTDRKLEDVVNEFNTTESVPTWCAVDTRIGALTVHLEEGRCFDAEVYADDTEEMPTAERPEDYRIVIGKWILRNLFDKYIPVHIDTHERELWKAQHPEEAAAGGSLTNPSPHPGLVLPIPTTRITNEKNELIGSSGTTTTGVTLLSGIELPNINTALAQASSTASLTGAPAAKSLVGSQGTPSGTTGSSPASAVPGSPGLASHQLHHGAPANTHSPLASPQFSPMSFSPTSPSTSSGNGFMGRLKTSVKKLARTPSAEQRFENGRQILNSKKVNGHGSKTHSTTTTLAAIVPSASIPLSAAPASVATTLSSAILGGDFSNGPELLLLKADDQSSEYADSASSHSSDSASANGLNGAGSQTLAALVLRPPHPPFTPATATDCPLIEIPSHIPVIISEQSREASTSVDLYRGAVGTLGRDFGQVIQVIPGWVLEVLLKNTIPFKDSVKVGFTLVPFENSASASGIAVNGVHGTDASSTSSANSNSLNINTTINNNSPQLGTGALGGSAATGAAGGLHIQSPPWPTSLLLPALPGGSQRLTAPRMLRVRKILGHVVEKLELTPPRFDPKASYPKVNLSHGGPRPGMQLPPPPQQQQQQQHYQHQHQHQQTTSGTSVSDGMVSADASSADSTTKQANSHCNGFISTVDNSPFQPLASVQEEQQGEGIEPSTAPSATAPPAASSEQLDLGMVRHCEATLPQEASGPFGENLGLQQRSSSSETEEGADASGAAAATLAQTEAEAVAAAVMRAEAQQRLEEEENQRRIEHQKPENWIELLCNDQVLGPEMTLATIRAHVWKSGGNLVLAYRRKAPPVPPTRAMTPRPSTPVLQ